MTEREMIIAIAWDLGATCADYGAVPGVLTNKISFAGNANTTSLASHSKTKSTKPNT